MTKSLRELIDIPELTAALTRLEKIEDALRAFRDMQPVQDGDRVVLLRHPDCSNGWRHFREILIPGSTGFVCDLDWNQWSHRWQVMFSPEVAWEVHDHYDQARSLVRRHHHEDSDRGRSLFALPAEWFRQATESDSPLTRPDNSIEWPLRQTKVA